MIQTKIAKYGDSIELEKNKDGKGEKEQYCAAVRGRCGINTNSCHTTTRLTNIYVKIRIIEGYRPIKWLNDGFS